MVSITDIISIMPVKTGIPLKMQVEKNDKKKEKTEQFEQQSKMKLQSLDILLIVTQ